MAAPHISNARGNAMRQLSLVGVIVFIACASSGAQPTGDRDQRLTLFTRYLDSLRIQAGIPGLSAAITSNGRITWEGGLGFADLEARIAAAPHTPYPIASITKTASSTLLMQCVEEGRLNLDAPMRTYTAAVPDANATVRPVLAMASDTAVGSTYRYDGDRFTALTPVVEACTGQSYRVAVARRILDRRRWSEETPAAGCSFDCDRSSTSMPTCGTSRRSMEILTDPDSAIGSFRSPGSRPAW
jgi:CubicO group peptidase (beta-lactamase class C family)